MSYDNRYFKSQLKESLIEDFELKRYENFEKDYRTALRIGKQYYNTEDKHKLNVFVEGILNENLINKSKSILNLYRETKGKSIKEKFGDFDKNFYVIRTADFFKEYGKEKFKGKQLKTYLKNYLEGKITKEMLSNIILQYQALPDQKYKENYESSIEFE